MSGIKDFAFQGKMFLADRLSTGKPGPLRWVGDAAQLMLTIAVETTQRKESYTGQKHTSVHLQTGQKGTFKVTLHELNKENLELAFQGTALEKAAGSASGESLPSGLVNNDNVMLAHPRISALVMRDGSPLGGVVMAVNTNYKVEDAKSGIVKIVSIGAYTQPFRVFYDYEEYINLTLLDNLAQEKYLILDGINTVDGERVIVRLYRAKFDPVSDFALITDDLGNMELSGTVLYDVINAANSELGGFGSMQLPAE